MSLPMAFGFGLGSFGLDQASSAINSHRQWKYAKRAMWKQYEINKKAQLEYYSNARKSLTDADYNPLLAVGNGTQGFSASPSAPLSDSDQGSTAFNSAISAYQAEVGAKNTKANTEKTEAETDVLKYGKSGAIAKNLIKLAKESKDPMVRKMVDSQIANITYGDPSVPSSSAVGWYKNWFARQHPNTYKLIYNLRHGDYTGAKDAIHAIGSGIKSRHSAVSFGKTNPYLDKDMYHDGNYDYQYINDIDKYDKWNKEHKKYKEYSSVPKHGGF